MKATAQQSSQVRYSQGTGTLSQGRSQADLFERFLRRYGRKFNERPNAVQIFGSAGNVRPLTRSDIEMLDSALFASGDFVYDID